MAPEERAKINYNDILSSFGIQSQTGSASDIPRTAGAVVRGLTSSGGTDPLMPWTDSQTGMRVPPALTSAHTAPPAGTMQANAGLRAPGSGFIVTADGRVIKDYGDSSVPAEVNTGGTHMADAGPQLSTGGGGGGAGDGMPPMAPMLPPVNVPHYSPDTSDTSMGGMFTQGLRMKQDRAYAGMNNAADQLGITARGQDLQGQIAAMNAANEADKTKIAGMREQATAGLTQAQTTASEVDSAAKLRIASLLNKATSEKDPALRAQYEQQARLAMGHPATPIAPHVLTIADAAGQQHPMVVQPTANGSAVVSTEQDMLSTRQKIDAAAAGMAPKDKQDVAAQAAKNKWTEDQVLQYMQTKKRK